MPKQDPPQPPTLPPPEQIILRDGTTASLRPARADDVEKLEALFARASLESVWLRFFTAATRVSRREIDRMLDIDGVARMTYVVTRGEDAAEHLLAIGNYVRLPRWDTAEVAFFVDDAYHGRGLGTVLLERLAAYAKQQRILTIVATVRPENEPMLGVFRKSGFEPHIAWDEGVMRVELPATPSEKALAQAEAREKIATAASLDPFFRPQSIAVVGIDRQGLGRRVFEQLIRSGFSGPVYPVHPHARSIAAVRAFPSLAEIPDEIELAILAVPAEQMLAELDACAAARVRVVLVLSAGFEATDADGVQRRTTLLGKVRAHGMRMVGPNCIGLLNTAPDISLNATVLPDPVRPGRIAVLTQSGALGAAALDALQGADLGISMFVNVGDKADVSGNDLLQYWEEDPATDLILVYLESFGNPRKFARIARRAARRKPIVAIKSGRAAARVTPADYGEYATEALFRQAGIIRAESLEESFEIATLLTRHPLLAGNRVAVVTNTAGLAGLCVDAGEAHGLAFPRLSPATLEACRGPLPRGVVLDNPLNLRLDAQPTHYATAVQHVLDDPAIDAIIVVYVPMGTAGQQELAEVVNQAVSEAEARADRPKPVLVCLLHQDRPASGHTGLTTGLPLFRFPEAAARALAHAARYAAWLGRPPGETAELGEVDVEAARRVIETALDSHGPTQLDRAASRALLAAAGLSVSEAAEEAEEADETAVIVRMVEDPSFGPLIGFGLSGAVAEVLHDRAFCITPLNRTDAQDLVRSIRGFGLLQRNHAAADLTALEDLLLRVSWLIEECPEIAALELQPVSVRTAGRGVVIRDGRVSVRPLRPGAGPASR